MPLVDGMKKTYEWINEQQMGKKTLLFTTIGKLNESKNSTDASESWGGFDVVVFGEDFDQHKEICDKYGFTLDTDYERTEFGLPIVRSLFESVKRYDGYDVYCYLNRYTFSKITHNI